MFFLQPVECCPLTMVRDTFLSFLLSLSARTHRDTHTRRGREDEHEGRRKETESNDRVPPLCRIKFFAGYQKGLRLLAQAASTFAREWDVLHSQTLRNVSRAGCATKLEHATARAACSRETNKRVSRGTASIFQQARFLSRELIF